MKNAWSVEQSKGIYSAYLTMMTSDLFVSLNCMESPPYSRKTKSVNISKLILERSENTTERITRQKPWGGYLSINPPSPLLNIEL